MQKFFIMYEQFMELMNIQIVDGQFGKKINFEMIHIWEYKSYLESWTYSPVVCIKSFEK